MQNISGYQIKKSLLDTIIEHLRKNPPPIGASLQSNAILNAVADMLNISGNESEQILLSIFYDLFREGHLSWGLNLNNPDPPFFHVTDNGKKLLENMSRDPFNPSGYLKAISGNLNALSRLYLNEALYTFNAGYFMSSSVMIGAAAENIILELRDIMLQKITTLSASSKTQLKHTSIKKVADALQSELNKLVDSFDKRLKEDYQSHWPSFFQQIRRVRNDAGHPENIEHISFDEVHASFLVFPMFSKLAFDLKSFIEKLP